jgi:hypothetical protein
MQLHSTIQITNYRYSAPFVPNVAEGFSKVGISRNYESRFSIYHVQKKIEEEL